MQSWDTLSVENIVFVLYINMYIWQAQSFEYVANNGCESGERLGLNIRGTHRLKRWSSSLHVGE